MTSSDRDCGADAAAYVLGALAPDEANAFRRHLETCSICQDEVATFEQVTGALATAVPQRHVPRGLRRRVMRAVRDEQRADEVRRGADVRDPATRRSRRLAPLGARPLLAGAAIALATAAVAVGVVDGVSGGSGAPRVIQARVYGSGGSAELRLDGGRGVLTVSRFPPPGAGHIYEVWLRRPGRPPAPTSALFSVTSMGAGEVAVPGSLAGVDAVLVTPEPDGGSRTPTHAPVIIAKL